MLVQIGICLGRTCLKTNTFCWRNACVWSLSFDSVMVICSCCWCSLFSLLHMNWTWVSAITRSWTRPSRCTSPWKWLGWSLSRQRTPPLSGRFVDRAASPARMWCSELENSIKWLRKMKSWRKLQIARNRCFVLLSLVCLHVPNQYS